MFFSIIFGDKSSADIISRPHTQEIILPGFISFYIIFKVFTWSAPKLYQSSFDVERKQWIEVLQNKDEEAKLDCLSNCSQL